MRLNLTIFCLIYFTYLRPGHTNFRKLFWFRFRHIMTPVFVWILCAWVIFNCSYLPAITEFKITSNTASRLPKLSTVEPLFNEVLDITNDTLSPGQNYSKMYGIEPRYNERRYNEFLGITNIIRKPRRKIYLDITNYNVNTRQKINAEQINSQEI